jgi:hypothetical protein
MATYQELAQKFARFFADVHVAMAGMHPGLQTLIDALPYYGDHAFQLAHRGTLANLLQVNLPNDPIAPQPGEAAFGGNTFYTYTGPYSGYRDAFYHGVGLSSAAGNLRTIVLASQSNLNDKWWADYAVITLTDAIRQAIGGALDTGKLAAGLTRCNSAFLPALAASYYAVYGNGFAPTANALQALKASGKSAQANTELVQCILSGQFTANINQAIAEGGESTEAAVWFLFNLWITLKSLGNPDVDDVIRKAQIVGLAVPPQVGPGSWWTGGYTSWWVQLSGSDVADAASGAIHAAMPQRSETSHPPQGGASGGAYNRPSIGSNAPANGYSLSLLQWGKLSAYSTSCFGKGTGVLMADGSVKPIEQVKLGDEVQSDDGPRKVLLIESPPRGGRKLYRPNRLNAYATVGHPFRTPPGIGPARVAVDPWDLMDSVPTMTEQGVGLLEPGCKLLATGPNGLQEVTLAQLDEFEADAGSEECLYDLVVEKRKGGVLSCYYVGGPDTFLAVDTETTDPLHSPPTTVAIVTAMSIALANCRRHLTDPGRQIPGILTQVRLPDALSEMRTPSPAANGKLARPKVPNQDFYMNDGAWDPHASMLECHLVRHFGRMLRRKTAMGWLAPSQPEAADHLAIVVRDFQLLGAVTIGRNAELCIKLRLREGNVAVRQQKLKVQLGAQPIWDIALDRVVEFGWIPQGPGQASLWGSVTVDAQEIGRFMATITEHSLNERTTEYLLFSGESKVVGRIAIDLRRNAAHELVGAQERRTGWKSRDANILAMNIGGQIGREIATKLEHWGNGV